MSAKHGFAVAVLLVLLAGPLAQAQMPASSPFVKGQIPVAMPADAPIYAQSPSVPPEQPNIQPKVGAYAPDAWVYQQQPNATGGCGPMGANGPIGSDVYARVGPSLVLTRTDFGKSLRTGWEIDGGGRSLFFSPEGDKAFIVDLGVTYQYNHGKPGPVFNLDGANFTVRNLYRTAASLGLGFDRYAFGPGFIGGMWDANFSYGFDGGARMGSSHVELNNLATFPPGLRRVQDVYFASFAGLHFDMEVPMGAWTFVSGVRAVWSFTGMDFIPGANTNLSDLGLLLTVGVRY